MASTLLTGTIADLINNSMSTFFLTATLIHDTASSNSPDINSFDPPAPTPTSYTCKAIVDMYSEARRADGFASQSDRKITILAQSLSVTPAVNDRITIRSATYTILSVDIDPALAAWECKARI